MPPEWRIEPADLSVTIGRTAVIDCQADGFPAARIEWRLSQGKRAPPLFWRLISLERAAHLRPKLVELPTSGDNCSPSCGPISANITIINDAL